MTAKGRLAGDRFRIDVRSSAFPPALACIKHPPKALYGIGSPEALREGLAVIGSRRATPYGTSAARHFAGMAARRGIAIISGGARGCDSAAHEAAVDSGTPTVAFFGGGCDWVYPAENVGLFQRIIEAGGAVVSEFEWSVGPKPAMFRQRNRLIASLAKATLIVEAGIPSGTFSTAEDAIEADREVWAIPGSLASEQSRGANLLISDGAHPIVGDDSFATHLSRLFGVGDGRADDADHEEVAGCTGTGGAILAAIRAQPLTLDEIVGLAREHGHDADALSWTMRWLVQAEAGHGIAKYPNGRYGPVTS